MPTISTRRASGQVSGEDIVIEAAWLYYHDGLNQNSIAKRLNVSRATVVNYLQEARERGYIHITLSPEAFTNHQMARQLCDIFGLRAAYVLPDEASDLEERFARVARGAANWLPSLLAPGDRLGVAWGKTIYDLAENMEETTIPDLTVFQLVGSMWTPYGFSAEVCSLNVARKLGARCINLHVPAVLSTAQVAKTFRSETVIADQLAATTTCNKLLFAVGSCDHDSHVVSSGVATHKELDWYVEQGAAGVLCGRFIDEQGAPVAGPLDQRMMGIELPDLLGKEMALLVSLGEDKIMPMIAALRGGYATHLVTGLNSAKRMLEAVA